MARALPRAGARTIRQSGRPGSTWPWPRRTRPASGGPSPTCRPAAFDAAAVLKLRVWLMAVRHDAGRRGTRAPGSGRSGSRQHQGARTAGRAHGAAGSRQGIRGARTAARPRSIAPTTSTERPCSTAKTSRAAPVSWPSLPPRWARPFDSQAWSILAEAQLARSRPDGGRPAQIRVGLLYRFRRACGQGGRAFVSTTQIRTGSIARRTDARRPARRACAARRSRRLGRRLRVRPDRRGPAPTSSTTPRRPAFASCSTTARRPQHLLPETMSGGLGLIDFDGDGWLDVYCVQGGPLHRVSRRAGGKRAGAGDRLFRNRGDGTFVDVTEASGLATIVRRGGYGLGVAVGDYDNDGHPDLFVTRLQDVCALPQPGRWHVRGRDRARRPGGRARQPDLGGLRRSRQRRRPRSLRLPLHDLGPRSTRASA